MADEATTEQAPEQGQPTEESSATEEQLGDAGKAALTAEREARKAADKRAKDLQRELESFRTASMTEAEKAVAEAEKRGAAAVRQEFGQRLAQERFGALAAQRNPDVDVAKVLKYVDPKTFIDEAGELNVKAIEAAVGDLVPQAQTPSGPPSFDGGARESASNGTDFNAQLRAAAGRT